MKSVNGKRAMMQKQIPTLVGLVILVVALVAGLFFFSNGTGVFAPRASAETTPKNIRVSNVSDKSFTISFYTDLATPGFIKYGTEPGKLKSQAADDRDQLAGVVDPYKLHHITVRGLDSGSTYYYVLGTGSGSTFDNQGSEFTITTAVDIKAPPPASKTIYGSVMNSGGTPAEGSIVYVTSEGVGDLSSMVRSSGSWAVSLANARDASGQSYAEIDDTTVISIMAQGDSASLVSKLETTVADSQPAADLTLGQSAATGQKKVAVNAASSSAAPITKPSVKPPVEPSIIPPSEVPPIDPPTSSPSPPSSIVASPKPSPSTYPLSQLATSSAVPVSTISAVLDLEKVEDATNGAKVVTQSKPKIQGKAKPNVVIQVSVHSEVEYNEEIVADENGDFEFDMSEYSEGLEPGEHTVTYTYVDPESGEEIEKTHTFYVEDTAAESTTDATSNANTNNYLAQADTTESDNTTYGSGNPYPISTPIPTSAATSSTKGSTRSAVVATDSGVFQAGSVGTTMILLMGGLFFIFTGVWSWWLAGQVDVIEVEE